MNILITGGAGYIGTVLTEVLLQKADIEKVYVLDNLMYSQDGVMPFCANPKYEFVYGDVRDRELLHTLLDKVDIVFPLAAIVGFPACDRDPRGAHEINFEHVDHIARTFKGRAIYPNSNSGYGATGDVCTEETPLSPISIYGKTKCEAEKSVLENGHTSLRLATVFGTSYRFRKDLLVNDFTLKAVTDGYIVLFEHAFKRNYIHIRDVVKAMIHFIGIPRGKTKEEGSIYCYRKEGASWDDLCYYDPCGQAYNVGLSSANLSKLELCEKIKEHIPSLAIETSEFNSDPDKRNYIVSNEKIESTGWAPDYSIDDGIKELLKAYKIFTNAHTNHTNL
jgi:nucleoside-diphosphate-sugar epimerase